VKTAEKWRRAPSFRALIVLVQRPEAVVLACSWHGISFPHHVPFKYWEFAKRQAIPKPRKRLFNWL
jgi:hypothetical protein